MLTPEQERHLEASRAQYTASYRARVAHTPLTQQVQALASLGVGLELLNYADLFQEEDTKGVFLPRTRAKILLKNYLRRLARPFLRLFFARQQRFNMQVVALAYRVVALEHRLGALEKAQHSANPGELQ